MVDPSDSTIEPAADGPFSLESVRARTPARILIGPAAPAYPTSTWLELRRDHAAARDAVSLELDPKRDLGMTFCGDWDLFETQTLATNRRDYLMNPDLGRGLAPLSRIQLAEQGTRAAVLQVAISDGLSSAAVIAQVPALLPMLAAQARSRGWAFGRPFFIHLGRVGILNDLGEILDPTVVVLLIGERPGLATARSLSAYLAYRPRIGHDDSRRNLVSNIHARGVSPEQAAVRIADLAHQMIELGTSGVAIKEGADAQGSLENSWSLIPRFEPPRPGSPPHEPAA